MRLLFTFMEVAVAFCFVLAGCRKSSPVDDRLQSWNAITVPGLSVALPNFGIKMSQVSSGAHINCGVDASSTVIAWGVGDFVEVPHYKVNRVVCADSGNAVVAAEGFTAFGYSGRFSSLVGSTHARRQSTDIAFTTNSDRRALDWSIEEDGHVLSTAGTSASLWLDGTFSRIAGGDWGICGLRSNGTMYCEAGAQTQPGTFTELAVGGAHACTIDKGGTLHCHGSNSHGQATPPEGAFSQVSAGRLHTCAISKAGDLTCWGAGRTRKACAPPSWECGQAVAPPVKWKSVQAGGYHTCAIAADDRVACWGLNDRGQAQAPLPPKIAESSLRCGLGPNEGSESPLLCWDEANGETKRGEAFVPNVAKIAGSETVLCILLEDGRVACLRAPLGEAKDFVPPFRVPDVRFATLEVDDKGACGTTVSGEPLCFTVANWAQAAVAEGAKAAFPAPMATLSLMADGHIEVRGHDWAKEKIPQGQFKKVCGGGQWYTALDRKANDQHRVHACALSVAGKISCWGDAPVVPAGVFEDIVCGSTFVCGSEVGGNALCGDREGQSHRSYDGKRLKSISTNGDAIAGATKELDERGYGVAFVYVGSEGGYTDPPKGLFDAYWLGPGVECARREGKPVTCWGRGAQDLRMPPGITLPRRSRPARVRGAR